MPEDFLWEADLLPVTVYSNTHKNNNSLIKELLCIPPLEVFHFCPFQMKRMPLLPFQERI